MYILLPVGNNQKKVHVTKRLHAVPRVLTLLVDVIRRAVNLDRSLVHVRLHAVPGILVL